MDEKRVIDKLRVSRTPFREAIGILAKGGLVEIKPYRGFYVRSFSRSENRGSLRALQVARMFCGRARRPANEQPRHPAA